MSDKKDNQAGDVVAATEAAVEKAVDKVEDQGYIGSKVDPTPNEAYTVAGVTSGAKTPETDPALAAEAQKAAGVGGTRFQHATAK